MAELSLLEELLKDLPKWRSQMYFQASLQAIARAMEDQILAGVGDPLVIVNLDISRFGKAQAHRYLQVAKKSHRFYLLINQPWPEDLGTLPDNCKQVVITQQEDIFQEWHLVVIAKQYATCFITVEAPDRGFAEDAYNNSQRKFNGIYTFDRRVSDMAARLLFNRILQYAPELKTIVNNDKKKLLKSTFEQLKEAGQLGNVYSKNLVVSSPDPFVQRLISHLQAGQYKLLKVNRALAKKNNKENLINSVTSALRRSFNVPEIMELTVNNLGKGLGVCRCIAYLIPEHGDQQPHINYEFLKAGITSVKTQPWNLMAFRSVQTLVEEEQSLLSPSVATDHRLEPELKAFLSNAAIEAWLIVPIIQRQKLWGILELHHCNGGEMPWGEEELDLSQAIAAQLGIALLQAQAYNNLEEFNHQLEALDQARSNLVAITGHELRTPLSTIQVCLESLATEPDMAPEMKEIMLSTALEDADRMKRLVQDFLMLSKLEGGRIDWNLEPISLWECLELAFSNAKARLTNLPLPKIDLQIPQDLPLVEADGEWLVELLANLIHNACKFTQASGLIQISCNLQPQGIIVVTVRDNGRGIEPSRLETIFNYFYQEEGHLRRSQGGTGLGLSICRQIVKGWGGRIWAESKGKDLGSAFHFTVHTIQS